MVRVPHTRMLPGAVALLLLLGGCGAQVPEATVPARPPSAATAEGPGGGPPSADTPATRSPGATSEDPAPGTSIPPAEFMAKLRTAQHGVDSVRMGLVMTGPETVSMTGAMDYRDGTRMQLSIDLDGEDLELVVADEQAWLRVSWEGDEPRWYALTPEQMAELELAELTTDLDVVETWEGWDTGARSVKLIGTEQVDGEPRTHYAVTVDMPAALEATGDPVPPNMPETVVHDVYLDERDLMREVGFTVGPVQARLTMEDWGAEVDIETPEDADPLPF